jgi:hypothetical protein
MRLEHGVVGNKTPKSYEDNRQIHLATCAQHGSTLLFGHRASILARGTSLCVAHATVYILDPQAYFTMLLETWLHSGELAGPQFSAKEKKGETHAQ